MTPIDRIVADLEAKGHWTSVCHLRFPHPQYPVEKVEYGRILSDGRHEAKIGTVNVYRDGTVVKGWHL